MKEIRVLINNNVLKNRCNEFILKWEILAKNSEETLMTNVQF